MSNWETVENRQTLMRRFRVPGGWLYQVERQNWSTASNQANTDEWGWHQPVFVPDPVCTCDSLSQQLSYP